MPIQKSPRQGQHAVWKTGTYSLCQPNFKALKRRGNGTCRSAPSRQRRAHCRPALLERNQARIVEIRPPEIEFFNPGLSGLLDRLPEQQRRGTQIVKFRISPPVLVNRFPAMI